MTLKLREPQGERKMGLTHVVVELRSPGSDNTFRANFLVDTGATDSMAPASELTRIGIKPVGAKVYELASGELQEYQVGYAEFSFLDDTNVGRVIFGPDDVEPILGVIALELAGITIDPTHQTLKKLPALPLK
jgi:clan AA aspartic protease